MLSINTTIDANSLSGQLKYLGMLDFTKYSIKDTKLISVRISNEYAGGKSIFCLISIYEITLEQNGKSNLYTVKVTNKNNIDTGGVTNYLNNTIEIYE